ncbi:hypothetical protein B0T20DRAFT_429841 [Sordaria brevicollis]|uniref:Uncharacterized protein n=1 Tax=Sordaria brevicollis TaxID=83679 RepID=A0AAE0PNW4_SORBR|nr:hypothetical protein B0T20DRAFT_429841 [Sordaria brevicollis]
MDRKLLCNDHLVSLIIDQIGNRTDRESLRLTCRAFEAHVSRHIFRRISVSNLGDYLTKFLCIAYSPRLNKHVQELTWLELDYPALEIHEDLRSIQAGEARSHGLALFEKLGLIWHSFLSLKISSGGGHRDQYKVHDGLLPVFLDAIAQFPKLRTFNSTRIKHHKIRDSCGNEVAQARRRDLRSHIREGSYETLASLMQNFVGHDILRKGFELYLLPALAQKKVAEGRWLQVNWLGDYYLDHSSPRLPLQWTHVPCISEALVEFTFSMRDINSHYPLSREVRRSWHLELQHKLLGCLQTAKNLKTLRISLKRARPLRGKSLLRYSLEPQTTDKDYFFDLLAGHAASPNTGKLHLPKLRCLSLENISYSHAGLAKFVQRHADTLRAIELSDCRLDFATIKHLARLNLKLDKFEVTSVDWMVSVIRARSLALKKVNGSTRPVWARLYEYIPPQSLLNFVNNHTTPRAQWSTLEPGRFGRIPYQDHYNFFVTTEDVRAGHFDMDRTEQAWEKLFVEGNGVDFRKPQDENIQAFLRDQHSTTNSNSRHDPIDREVVYPAAENKRPLLVTSDPVLLEELKMRALEVSVTAADVQEIRALMDNCKREEAELEKEGSRSD